MLIPKILKHRIEKDNDFKKIERSEVELKTLIDSMIISEWEKDILSFAKNRTAQHHSEILRDILLSLEANIANAAENHREKYESYDFQAATCPSENFMDLHFSQHVPYGFYRDVFIPHPPSASGNDEENNQLNVG